MMHLTRIDELRPQEVFAFGEMTAFIYHEWTNDEPCTFKLKPKYKFVYPAEERRNKVLNGINEVKFDKSQIHHEDNFSYVIQTKSAHICGICGICGKQLIMCFLSWRNNDQEIANEYFETT